MTSHCPLPSTEDFIFARQGIIRILSGIFGLWQRDMVGFWRDRTRVLGLLVQPLLFLLILKNAYLSPIGNGKQGDQGVLFSGIVGMTVMFAASFAGLSLAWDREVGFIKSVLVAPLSRSAFAVSKCLGGGTIGVIQGSLLLSLYPFFYLSLSPSRLLEAIGIMAMIGWLQSGLVMMLALFPSLSNEGLPVLMNLVILPLVFFSGVFSTPDQLSPWIRWASMADPFTYGIDLLRRCLTGIHFFSGRFDLICLGTGIAVTTGIVLFLHRITKTL